MESKTTGNDLTDRRIVSTPIGPVCMSRTEYELYQQELALRKAREESAK